MKCSQWIEVRLDHLRSLREIDRLFSFMKRIDSQRNSFIYTLRRRLAGGRFQGTVEAQIRYLSQAARLGHWLDIEIESVLTHGIETVENLRRAGAKIIVSYHNFRETPRNFDMRAKQVVLAGGDLIKIATQTNSMSDAVRLLELQQRLAQEGQPSVVLGMGASGIVTRVLGPARGAVFTYASLAPDKESAPGQLTVSELQRIFRIDHINSRTRIYGILGWPVSHSLSPALYNAAFAHLQLNAVFLPFGTAHLGDFPFWTERFQVRGLSVTLPHKVKVLQFVSRIDLQARRVGAVNTLRQIHGQWSAHNTDVRGIEQPLEELRVSLKDKDVLLLGAGGAAQAAAAVLARQKAKVYICNRTFSSAKRLARQFDHRVIRNEETSGRHFFLIINATPVGQWPHVQTSPIDLNRVGADVVFDMVYNPPETRLLRDARQRGIRVIPGLQMFSAQAKAQFKILTGKNLPPAILRRTLKAERS